MVEEFEQWLDPAFWKAFHREESQRRARVLPRKREDGLNGLKPPPIRDRVFTDELKELARSIQRHGSARLPQSRGPDPAWRFEDLGPPLTGLAGSIARLYVDREGELPRGLLAEWNGRFSAMASAILLFSREEGVFRLLMSDGLDAEQRQNLWIAARDPFFTRDSVQSFVVDNILKENPFFAKRFTAPFLPRLNGIVSIPREDRSAPALLVFFFDREPPALPVEELRSALDWIHPLLVRDLDGERRVHLRRNIYEAAAREVRSFLNLADGARLVQLHFGSLVDGQVCQRFLGELRRIFAHQRNLLVLRLRHDGLKILLTPDSPVDFLLQTAEELAAGFGIEVTSFQMPVSADLVSSAVL